MRTWARLLVLLGVFVGIPAWLLGSQSGLRATLAVAQSVLGERLAVDGADGRWAGPLHLTGLRYASGGIVVAIDTVDLDWRPSRLLVGRLSVVALRADGVRIDVTTAADETREPREPFELTAPFPIEADELLVTRVRVTTAPGAAPIEIAEARLGGWWRNAWLHVETLAFTHPLTGPVRVTGDAVAAIGQAVLRDVRIELADGGRVTARGSIALSPERTAAMTLDWQALRWPLVGTPVVTSESGHLELEGDVSDLRVVSQMRLGAAAQLELRARRAASRIEADVTWTQLTYPLLQADARWRSPRGSARFTGTPAAYRWLVDAALASGSHAADLTAAGRGTQSAIEVERGELRGFGGTVRAQGRVAWAPMVVADATLTLRTLDPAALWPEWPGSLNGAARVATQVEGGTPRSDFELQLADSRLRGYPVQLDARGRHGGDVLQFSQVRLMSGETTVEAAGQVLPRFDLNASLDSPALANLWPDLAGAANLRLTLEGPHGAPRIVLEGEARELKYGTNGAKHVKLDADLHPQRPSRLALDATGLRAGRPIQSVSLQAEGTAAQHVATLEVRAGEGGAQLRVEGAADLRRRSWAGAVTGAELRPAGLESWALMAPAPLAASATEIRLEPLCLKSGESFVCGGAFRSADHTDVRLRLNNFGLSLLRPLMPADWRPEGSLGGSARLRLAGTQLRELEAELTSSAGSIQAGRKARLEFLPSTLVVRPDGAEVVVEMTLRLAQGGAQSRLRFEPGPDLLERRFAGGLDLDFPELSWLTLLTPEVSSASGVLVGDFALAGTVRDLLIDGEIQLSDGQIQLATPAITVSDIGFDFTTARNAPTRVAARATSGGGSLELTGVIERVHSPMLAEFTLTGRDFQASDTPAAKVWVSPDLNLKIDATQTLLTGELFVPKASITPKRIDIGASPSADQVIVGATEATVKRPFRSDMRLRLGEEVRFEGFGLKTRLEGEIRAIDEPGRPTAALGVLMLKGGRYRAYGQELEIEKGSLLFSGGALSSPALELRALRKPREDVTVGVSVRGTLDEPEFKLFSTPTMTQEQQLAWLVLGRPLEDTVGTDERARISGAALSLGLTGGGYVAGRLGKGLGFDEVSVGTRPGETAEQARLTIGKFISPRLFVSYGFGLFEPGRYFRLLYDIGRGFKLATETGVNTGGDILYTIER